MAREIELKIRLSGPEEFERRLRPLAVLEGNYHKVDTYFRGPSASFRLRESMDSAVVCLKEKTIEAGVEVSRETEFAVDSVAAFRVFCQSLGFGEWYRKEKRGRAWRWGKILVEVGTVSDLGWFAELELLIDEEKGPTEVETARRTLLEAVRSLGVDPACIEAKTYAELLGQRVR